MVAIDVKDGLIERVSLYKESSWFVRLDIWPFSLIYGLGLAASLSDTPSVKIAGLILVPIGLALHLLLFLLAQSSVTFRALIGKSSASSLSESSWVHVQAAKNAGKDRLVQVLRGKKIPPNTSVAILDSSFPLSNEFFQYQEVTYYYDAQTKTYVRLSYPTAFAPAALLDWQGYADNTAVVISLRRWGLNEFNIPVPHFLDLYMEHLVAPFFVFQVLCLFLWSLDDYWYYSLFTLFMLLLFEGVMCNQRQNNVLMMRNMRRPAYQIFAFRGKKWQVVSTDMLVPGDLISVTSDPAIDVNARSRNKNTSNEGKVVPCDTLLLSGSCVLNEAMLTGESIPKVKEAMLSAIDSNTLLIDTNHLTLWSRHTLLGGTLLQQHTNSKIETTSKLASIPDAPDGGCLGLVVKTGFATTQGELMRKILFATEGVTGTTRETFLFIGVLILFAIFAAAMVLNDGLLDAERNKFRLALHCIMIITSVVPPELPMELSLAITNSLGALVRNMVYCTEPFRISLAGKIDMVCFDKTGTLTKDEMILKGVAAGIEIDIIKPIIQENAELDSDLLEPHSASTLVKCVMASCHDLMYKNEVTDDMTDNILGDPLEIASFCQSGFKFSHGSRMQSLEIKSEELGYAVKIRQRYPFNSELKRMSVIATILDTKQGKEKSYVFCKGAPEVLQDYLKVVPSSYNEIAKKFMQSGKRVLALAFNPIDQVEQMVKSPRSSIEQGLLFAGFLVFDCDMKADSKGVVKELIGSNHKVIMITGDSIYTACNVAKRLGMTDNAKPSLVLVAVEDNDKTEDKKQLVWRTQEMDVTSHIPDKTDTSYSISTIDKLYGEHTLCVTGPALDLLQSSSSYSFAQVLKNLTAKIAIFARVSPQQKERIIQSLNEAGRYTLMCGDGTNDVGALKAAHVGVSIINNPKLEKKVEQASVEGGKKKKSSSKDRLARAMLELKEHEADPTLVKLGDASIASPFTAKRTSIDCVLTVIRQGRCTLVTTIQVYKVLALNCLATAYMMSSLYMKGLKQGDTQMTCSGLIVAALFFFLSQAKPLLSISESRPPSTVFNRAVLFSILGQFITHLLCMRATMMLCEAFANPDDKAHAIPDTKFTPNLVNTCMFVLANQMQVNNFWVNYRGAPFMEDLKNNVYFWYLLQGVYAALLIVVGGQFEPLNDLLQLVSLPNRDFQIYFLGILVGNAVVTYGIERLCRRLE